MSDESRTRNARSPESLWGKTRLGLPPWLWVFLVVVVILVVFAWPRIHVRDSEIPGLRSKVGRARSDMFSLAMAIEAYMVENNQYPASAKGNQGVNSIFPRKGGSSLDIQTFRIWTADDEKNRFMSLTTPTGFISSYPNDPFSPDGHGGAVYGYYNAQDIGYILFSAGPDMDYDLTEPQKYYDPTLTNPLPRLIIEKTYDPTNGSLSDGDIWRVKQ